MSDRQRDDRPPYPENEIKSYKQTQSLDAWRVLRIMAEFADGFESMTRLGPSVVIYGSTNQKPKEPKY